MNIAIDGRTIAGNKTGVGAYAERLVSDLLRSDTQNGYYLFWVEPNDNLTAPNLTKILVPGYNRMFRNRYFENFIVPRALRKYDIDIFFAPAYALPFFVRFGKALERVPLPPSLRYLFNSHRKVKYVVTIHDVIALLYPRYFTMKLRIWIRFFVWNALHAADRVIAVSESTKNDLVRLYPGFKDRVTVVLSDLDSRFQIVTSDSLLSATRKKYSLPDKFILYVGTIEPRKNVDGIAAAYRKLPPVLQSQYHLVIGGNVGWFSKKVIDEIISQDIKHRVHFIGYVDDAYLPSLFTLASAFVFPSFYEGFGYPPLEAMACGVPVVSSHRSSLPEAVGDAALLVDPANVEDIATAIGRILTDERLAAELRRKGLERARLFSSRHSAEKTLKVFEELMHP